MKDSTAQELRSGRLVPVVIIEDAAMAVDLADALLDAGLRVIEITFRTAAAAAAISRIASQRSRMLVGAGTLLSPANVQRAVDAGARFGLAPGLNQRTVEAAAVAGLDFIPGVATASEVELALENDFKLLKVFPAEAVGGVALLKAWEGPYGHTGVQFLPTGGIHAGNVRDYFALQSVAAVGGSWFVDKKLIAAGDWPAINRLTREALAWSHSGGLLDTEIK
jgi:2-dehydro-3-deoxyphosphogluconate aldolase/(4S)-4-hydroxy-2-oxoglutarate aldolase